MEYPELWPETMVLCRKDHRICDTHMLTMTKHDIS